MRRYLRLWNLHNPESCAQSLRGYVYEVLRSGEMKAILESRFSPLPGMRKAMLIFLISYTALKIGFPPSPFAAHARHSHNAANLQPVTTKTGSLRCTGSISNADRRISLAAARLEDEGGKLYAHATVTCLIFDLAQDS